MKTLHTINKAGQSFEHCLRAVVDGDAILLIEEGVYALLAVREKLEKLRTSCKVMALESDLEARGINAPDYCLTITYEEFVEQSVVHEKVLSWF